MDSDCKSMQRLYPTDWEMWSPKRRKAEEKRFLAVKRAGERYNKALMGLEASYYAKKKALLEAYEEAQAKARAAYHAGED